MRIYPPGAPVSESLKAWVAFCGRADFPWLRVLKPGFRHCYVILHDGRQWFSLDPMLHRMEVKIYAHVPGDFDLPGWLRGRGQVVVEAPLDTAPHRPAPLALLTCVEAVKRVLGLHRAFIFTPWQLYHYLAKKETYHG